MTAPDIGVGESPAGMEELRRYSRSKQDLAAQIRSLRRIAHDRGNEKRVEDCRQLMVKLAEDRFTLAVVGQFKRGKSSLMNAIIGRRILPTGMLPVTSTITALRFGPVERLLIHRRGWSFVQQADLSQLQDYVTEKGNPGNVKEVLEAWLELPSPFLRRGLEFVDTPGVGSVIEANTVTTNEFLPQCDAVIFVTSVDSPMTAVETDFLARIRRHVHKIFFVINKTDLLGEAERHEVLDFIRGAIRREVRDERLKFFPLSSRQGLDARLACDAQAFAQSGVSDFEEELALFLSQEKARTLLAAIIDRTLRLLAEERNELDIQARSPELSPEELSERVAKLEAAFAARRTARRTAIEGLCAGEGAAVCARIDPQIRDFAKARHQAAARRIRRLMRAGRWKSGRHATGLMRDWFERRLRREAAAWLTAHGDSMARMAKERLEADRASIEAELRAGADIVAKVLGIGAQAAEAACGREEIGQWQIRVEARAVNMTVSERLLQLPAWLSVLPVRLTARVMEARLLKAGAVLNEECRRLMAAAVAEAVDGGVRKALEELDARARDAEKRLLALVRRTDAPTIGGIRRWREELDSLEANLVALRSRIAAPDASAPAQPDAAADDRPTPAPPRDSLPAEAAGRPAGIADDLLTRGCPACSHLGRVLFDFYAHWQYALGSDRELQDAFAAESGFCGLHTWQLLATSSPHGASLGFARFAERTARRLLALPAAAGSAKRVDALVPGRTCRVCALLREREQEYLARMAAFLGCSEGRDKYAASQGLCLRHLARLLARVPDETAGLLLSAASRRFCEFAEDMDSFSTKRDAMRSGLSNRDEEDAYLRAVIHLAGDRTVVAPWDMDGDI